MFKNVINCVFLPPSLLKFYKFYKCQPHFSSRVLASVFSSVLFLSLPPFVPHSFSSRLDFRADIPPSAAHYVTFIKTCQMRPLIAFVTQPLLQRKILICLQLVSEILGDALTSQNQFVVLLLSKKDYKTVRCVQSKQRWRVGSTTLLSFYPLARSGLKRKTALPLAGAEIPLQSIYFCVCDIWCV